MRERKKKFEKEKGRKKRSWREREKERKKKKLMKEERNLIKYFFLALSYSAHLSIDVHCSNEAKKNSYSSTAR